jgi:hypothetical protein
MYVPTTALPLPNRTRKTEFGPLEDDWNEHVAPKPTAALVASLDASVARLQRPPDVSASTEMIWLQSVTLEPLENHTDPENRTRTLDKSGVMSAESTDTLVPSCSRMETGTTGTGEGGHWPWLLEGENGPPTAQTDVPGVPLYNESPDETVMVMPTVWGLVSAIPSANPRTETTTGTGRLPLAANTTADGWITSCGHVTTAPDADPVHTSTVVFTAVTWADAKVTVTFCVGMLVNASVKVSVSPVSSTSSEDDDEDNATQLQIDGQGLSAQANLQSEPVIHWDNETHCILENPGTTAVDGAVTTTDALSASITLPIHVNDEGTALWYAGSTEAETAIVAVTRNGVEITVATPSPLAITATEVHTFQSAGKIVTNAGWTITFEAFVAKAIGRDRKGCDASLISIVTLEGFAAPAGGSNTTNPFATPPRTSPAESLSMILTLTNGNEPGDASA